jgi:hypothetical protein
VRLTRPAIVVTLKAGRSKLFEDECAVNQQHLRYLHKFAAHDQCSCCAAMHLKKKFCHASSLLSPVVGTQQQSWLLLPLHTTPASPHCTSNSAG